MKKLYKACSLTLAAVLMLSGTCLAAEGESALGLNTDSKEATEYTIDANEQVYALLDFEDERELENAKRGLIAAPDSLEIKSESGKVIWSQDAYAFVDEEAPGSANPSLWRDTQLNHISNTKTTVLKTIILS